MWASTSTTALCDRSAIRAVARATLRPAASATSPLDTLSDMLARSNTNSPSNCRSAGHFKADASM